MYIDSHAHLSGETLFPVAGELIERALLAGVEKIVNIATDKESLEKGLLLSKKYLSVYNTAATTPHDVEKEGELFFPIVEEAAKKGLLVGIGETGLDYYYEYAPKEMQKTFLIRYFNLAKQWNLPLVIHCREAFSDLFAFADEHYKNCPAVLHCFTGTLEEAKEVIKRGWYISFSGIVTFKKSEALRATLKEMPLERIFIETDAPYLAPQSKRGKVNEPSYILETASVVAEVKGISLTDVAHQTFLNASAFFPFSKVNSLV